jgi:hypothetical protein
MNPTNQQVKESIENLILEAEDNELLKGQIVDQPQINETIDHGIKQQESPPFKYIDKTARDIGLNFNENITTFLKGNDLSSEVMEVINILSINDIDKSFKKTPTAGSFKWKAQKYPGDIDMLEFYDVKADSKEQAIEKVANSLYNIAKDIQKNQNVILADFKCGYDPRFDNLIKYMGRLDGVYVLANMIEYFETDIMEYNKDGCILELNKLNNLGAITNDTKQQLLDLLPDIKMTGDVYAKMYSIIRKLRLLRWTVGDILNRSKIIYPRVEGKSTYLVPLKTAINHDTITKLDLWAKIRRRWTEVTNIYIFKYINNQTNESEPIGFYFKNTVDEATGIVS